MTNMIEWFLILYWRTWKPWYYIEGHENLDIIWKDMRTLILYWRTWKPWYYIEGHENQLNSIENAILPENNRERLSSMLFKRRIIFYSFKLSFLHCSLFFFFKIFLGIFLRGRIILHSWKFTFLWEWTTYFSIVSCPCWIKQKFLFKLSLPGEELACKLQLSEARVQVPLNSLKLKLRL